MPKKRLVLRLRGHRSQLSNFSSNQNSDDKEESIQSYRPPRKQQKEESYLTLASPPSGLERSQKETFFTSRTAKVISPKKDETGDKLEKIATRKLRIRIKQDKIQTVHAQNALNQEVSSSEQSYSTYLQSIP